MSGPQGLRELKIRFFEATDPEYQKGFHQGVDAARDYMIWILRRHFADKLKADDNREFLRLLASLEGTNVKSVLY